MTSPIRIQRKRTGLIVAVFCALSLAACDERPGQKYRIERTLAKVCREGTHIWSWRGDFYVYDTIQIPDAKVSAPIGSVCE